MEITEIEKQIRNLLSGNEMKKAMCDIHAHLLIYGFIDNQSVENILNKYNLIEQNEFQTQKI